MLYFCMNLIVSLAFLAFLLYTHSVGAHTQCGGNLNADDIDAGGLLSFRYIICGTSSPYIPSQGSEYSLYRAPAASVSSAAVSLYGYGCLVGDACPSLRIPLRGWRWFVPPAIVKFSVSRGYRHGADKGLFLGLGRARTSWTKPAIDLDHKGLGDICFCRSNRIARVSNTGHVCSMPWGVTISLELAALVCWFSFGSTVVAAPFRNIPPVIASAPPPDR